MFYRCELLVGGLVYDVTDALVNWDDVELTFKRGDYDGVVRSFSTKFEFANEGYSVLVGEYLSNYLDASASVAFYKRNNSWLWNEVFRCSLDFSTFSYDGVTCQVNAVDSSLAALIKAKKGTQYEYSVERIKESEPLKYDHLEMTNNAVWTIPPSEDSESTEFPVTENGYIIVPLYVKSQEILLKEFEVIDQQQTFYVANDYINNSLYFLKNSSSEILAVHLKAKFKVIFNASSEYDKIAFSIKGSEYPREAWSYIFSPSISLYNFNIDTTFYLFPGEYVDLYMFMMRDKSTTHTIYDVEMPPTITFKTKSPVDKIDVVKPVTLLNRLLQSMNGGNEGLTGEIADTDERLNNTMLMAADSARGMKNAKLYSSYTKFCNWMSAEFGFVPVVGDSSVRFVHRDTLFQDKEVKDLGNDCTEFEYSVNAGMIYSRVRVGYDKVDYESVNGKDEFRFTQEYTTGTELTDNSLELISPYRADAYGIEFLVNKRGEDTTDNESDNDVFMVGAKLNGESYELIREGYTVSGVISPESMFNVMYSQSEMIGANSKYIGVFCKLLEYASSDGNSEVAVNGVALNGDIEVPERLFTVGEVSVETGDTEVPTELSGYISLTKNGKRYSGYLKDVDFGVGKSKSVKYTLIVREVL